MNFSFESIKDTNFTSNSQSYLKPYDIYKVKLTKIESTTLNGKDGTVYPIVAVEFTGEQGIFSTNLFVPNKDSDFERTENANTHKTQPSSFDRFQFTLMQIVENINPAGAQKIKENASKLKTLEDFVGIVIKALNGKDTEVYLKLVGRNANGSVYANLPTSCWFDNSENRPKPLNFISTDASKLNFSAYEVQQMNAYKNAKPTNMDTVASNPDTSDGDDNFLDDIDL